MKIIHPLSITTDDVMPFLSATSLVRGLWRVVFYGVVLSFVGFVLFLVFGPVPFGEINREFIDLAGPEARPRLQFMDGWPQKVDPAEVPKMSQKYTSTIDSHSTWYRIQLAPAAAATWRDAIHSKEERTYEGELDHIDEGVEGVHRTVSGPPPLHRQTGSTPGWWSPPAIDFRATELMKWYKRFDSGVGRATYSGYDESANTLWIYQYSAQHDLLWTPGDVPAGEQFTTIGNAVHDEGKARVPPSDDMDADGD